MSGTHLGAAVPNLLYNKKRVDADGIPAVTKGRIYESDGSVSGECVNITK